MNDASDLLDHLDRRAAAAVADLDRIVDAAAVPAFTVDLDRAPLVGARGRGWRDPRLLAAAAAVVAVALVAAVLVLRDEREQTTVATPGTPRRLVLPADLAADFDTVTAFQGDGGGSALELTVQAPAGDGAPWPTVVVEHALPEDTTTLDGETVDIGGPEATFETDMAPSIGWHDGDVVRYLSSGSMTRDELVDLARRTVAEGIRPGDALPGHEVLHRGPTTDLITMYNADAHDPDFALTTYTRGSEEDSEAFVVASGRGSAERLRAAYALSSSHESLQVRGVDAILARYESGWSEGWQEVLWIEDGTLVRASFTTADGADRDELLALVEQLVVVSDDEWGDLVGLRPTDTAAVEEGPIDDVAPEGSDPVVLRWGGPTAAVWVEEDDFGNLLLTYSIETGSSGSAGSGGIDDLAQTVVRRDTGTDGWTLFYGVLDADVDAFRLVDPSGRAVEPAAAIGVSASAPGRLLFVALVPAEDDTADLSVELTRSTGAVEVVPVEW